MPPSTDDTTATVTEPSQGEDTSPMAPHPPPAGQQRKRKKSMVRDAAHHKQHITSKRNVAHNHKSAKFAHIGVTSLVQAKPRSLPQIAQDPFHSLRAPVQRPTELSPYISPRDPSPDSVKFRSYVTPSPPKQYRSTKEQSPANRRAGTNSPDGDTQDDGAQSSPARNDVDGEDTGEEPSPSSEVRPNELTLTYMKTLSKSEDFNRRAILRREVEKFMQYFKIWQQFVSMVEGFTAERHQFVDEEAKDRKDVVSAEVAALNKLKVQKEQGYRNAKRHEDIRPECPVITANRKVHLDPKLNDGLLVELRWRGGVYAIMNVLMFDDSNNLLGVATTTEVLRGHQGSVAVKHVVSAARKDSATMGGSSYSFLVIPANCPVKTSRLVFAVFNSAYPGAPLSDMHRSWFTLRSSSDGGSILQKKTELKDVYACNVVAENSVTCVVAASLVRHSSGEAAWQFACHNEPFIWVTSAHRLAPLLVAANENPNDVLEDQVTTAYQRIGCVVITGFWEDISRRAIAAEEADAASHIMMERRSAEAAIQAAREKRKAQRHRNASTILLEQRP